LSPDGCIDEADRGLTPKWAGHILRGRIEDLYPYK
jgi:hypothetical protein